MTNAADELGPLLSALDKLPSFRGLSYRGSLMRQGPVRPRAVVSGVLLATSTDPRVATENFSTPSVYAVIGWRGRSLAAVSRHPGEQEVVFRPGTAYLPLERSDVDGIEVAIVEEIDPDADLDQPPEFTLDELKDQMRAAIVGARAEAGVQVTSPGKFVGTLQ